MKTTSCRLRLLLLLLPLSGCTKSTVPPDSGGVPVIPVIAYDIVLGPGNTTSWFRDTNPVTRDSVFFEASPRSGILSLYRPDIVTLRGRLCLKEPMGPFVYEVQPANSLVYVNNRLIHLGKLDVDTLRLEASPAVFSSFAKVEKLRYYYNGRLSASYDFRANPGQRDSLMHIKDFGLVVPLHKFTRR